MNTFEKTSLWITPLLAFAVLSGCQSYVTPGGAADLSLLLSDEAQDAIADKKLASINDPKIREIYQRQPTAILPTHLVMARIQEVGYQSYSCRGCGRGAYSVITVRDIETDDAGGDNSSNLGGLCGFNRGAISHCHARVSVSGDRNVGALCGRNWDGTISDCYATRSASGDKSVRNLVGRNKGPVMNCYWNSESSE